MASLHANNLGGNILLILPVSPLPFILVYVKKKGMKQIRGSLEPLWEV